jgi:hypothetical protein
MTFLFSHGLHCGRKGFAGLMAGKTGDQIEPWWLPAGRDGQACEVAGSSAVSG